MPKLKTHKATKKRVHITGSGKLMMSKGEKSHLRRKKPARVRRMYDDKQPVSSRNAARLRQLLPYG